VRRAAARGERQHDQRGYQVLHDIPGTRDTVRQ
jgi:hypothetical protein